LEKNLLTSEEESLFGWNRPRRTIITCVKPEALLPGDIQVSWPSVRTLSARSSLSGNMLQSLPKRVFHTVRSCDSTFKFHYNLFSLISSRGCWSLLPRLSVPSIFPSIMHFTRQYLRKMWRIQLAFHHLILCRMFFSSLTPCNNSWFFILSFQLIFSIFHKQHVSKISRYFWSIFRSVQKSLL